MAMGKCPHCGGENLDYGAIEIKGENAFYPRTCCNCGAEGNEWYELSYCEQEIVSYPPDDLSDSQKENVGKGTTE